MSKKTFNDTGMGRIIAWISAHVFKRSEAVTTQTLGIDSTPTGNSSNLITSGGVYSAVIGKEDVTNKVTELNSSSTNTNYPSAAAVVNYVANYVDNTLTSILKYKDVVNSNSDLPATHETGWVYVVATAGTYAGQSCEVGDIIICKTSGTVANNNDWNIINGENQVENKSASLANAGSYATLATVDGTNITVTTPSTWTGVAKTGTVTDITITTNSPISINSTDTITGSGSRTISHANSGVTAGTYKSVTVNATGHVTGGTNPTTLSGYGITDAKIASGTITLGSNTITPLTSSSTLDATKLSGTIPSSCYTDNDTKNTAGSTDTSSKIFLIGATTQAANPQTYSDNEVYATSGVLTTKSVQVGGTSATMQYNSTDDSIEFVFS